jgi:hypothetical protein
MGDRGFHNLQPIGGRQALTDDGRDRIDAPRTRRPAEIGAERHWHCDTLPLSVNNAMEW